jgi:wyosine [tRNA(Phe)-imidazoG37] synthetase (radical SAM superfamily)|uniref:Radical SAM protein n=1 Tax=Desulfobacca acetoxidans TaxID=60893 RepID=A0A7C3UZT7_9BACT
MSHLFGPVPSRRLGLSLGVDLIPPKTCTFDCLYCEVGRTTHLTGKRRAYRVAEIIGELTDYLQSPPGPLDYVTLAGSGEPTLNLGLGDILTAVKHLTQTPVAILTNGSLFHLPEVRAAAAGADVILPSLDAGREQTFQRLNRPHPGLSLDLLVSGLKALRREFAGRIWLEIMVLKGINDNQEELTAIKGLLRELAPDKVHLNTAVRPVADGCAQALSQEDMEAVADFLGDGVEVVAAARRISPERLTVRDREVIEMLARRPMTARDLAQALGAPLAQVRERLGRLLKSGLVRRDVHQDQDFYRSLVTSSS